MYRVEDPTDNYQKKVVNYFPKPTIIATIISKTKINENENKFETQIEEYNSLLFLHTHK